MRSTLHTVLTVVLGLSMAFAATAQEEKKSEQSDASTIEQQWVEYGRPGREHQELARLVGDWKAEIKSYYGNPSEPKVSEGTAKFRKMMGGRFVRQNFDGEVEGQPFQGMGITGYDKGTKAFVSVWIDNLGTGMIRTEGQYDPKTHEMVETGVSSSPNGEEKVRMVTRYESDDKFTFTLFMVSNDGQETKAMDIVYTRVPGEEKKAKKAKAE